MTMHYVWLSNKLRHEHIQKQTIKKEDIAPWGMALSLTSVTMGSVRGASYCCFTSRWLKIWRPLTHMLPPKFKASTSFSSSLFPQGMWAHLECRAGSRWNPFFRAWAPLTPGQHRPSAGLQRAPHSSGKALPTYSSSHLNITTCWCPRVPNSGPSSSSSFSSSHMLLMGSLRPFTFPQQGAHYMRFPPP